jgi:hypothetical protein
MGFIDTSNHVYLSVLAFTKRISLNWSSLKKNIAKKLIFWGTFVWQVPEILDVQTPKAFQLIVGSPNVDSRDNFENRISGSWVIVPTDAHPSTRTWKFLSVFPTFLDVLDLSESIGAKKKFGIFFRFSILRYRPGSFRCEKLFEHSYEDFFKKHMRWNLQFGFINDFRHFDFF